MLSNSKALLKKFPEIKFLWEFSEKSPAVQLDIISTISLATRKCICSFCALLYVMMWVAFPQWGQWFSEIVFNFKAQKI